MEWVSAMELESDMLSWAMLWPTLWPTLWKSTLTRSPPTPTSMPWLTTTLDPVSTPRSLTMAQQPGRVTTPSTCLTEGFSTSTTTPTTSTDMLLRSLTMALLPSPLPLLVSVMASPTVVWSVMASPMVVWSATVLESPTEEWLILAEKHARDSHIYLFVNKYEIGNISKK